MTNKTKTALRGIPGFFRTLILPANSHWPARVLDILETKYGLRPEDMRRLWYIHKRMANGNSLRSDLIYIYDWVKARERNISVRTSRDLRKYSDLVAYMGEVAGDGSIRLKPARNFTHN